MGATRLPYALKMLDDQKRDLFLSGGSKHAIYTTAGRLDEVESGLMEVRDYAAEYGRQSTRLESIERDLNALRERRLSVESELRHHQNLERAWDVWNDLVSAQRQLEDLPDIANFPANGVNRLDTLNARADDARREMDSAVERVSNIKESAALSIEHQSILDQSDAVRDLQRRRAAFDQSVKDVPERQAELDAMRVRLKDALSDLGPDWDADRLTKFDCPSSCVRRFRTMPTSCAPCGKMSAGPSPRWRRPRPHCKKRLRPPIARGATSTTRLSPPSTTTACVSAGPRSAGPETSWMTTPASKPASKTSERRSVTNRPPNRRPRLAALLGCTLPS